MSKLQTRRQFIRNTGYVAMGVAFMGCGSEDTDPPTDDDTADDGSSDNGTTNNEPPVWSTIPAQTWTVGVPVYLDLNDYVTDADGDALTITLDKALPDGVSLNGTIISGTPTAATDLASYAATADDGYT
ncbi:MAG: hypothetical protein ABW098_07545 [Candidatus Thiodiazotropha sp.]